MLTSTNQCIQTQALVRLLAIAGQKLIFRLCHTVCQNHLVKTRTPTHKWTFRARFRYQAFGWKGSRLACQRLKEAVAEIKKLAKADPVTAANGAVILMEKIWPALEQVDSSSGALGGSVGWTLAELLPIVIEAPQTARRGTSGLIGYIKPFWKMESITCGWCRSVGASCVAQSRWPRIGRINSFPN